MKKIFTLGLASLAVLAVASCKKNDDSKKPNVKVEIPEAEGDWYVNKALTNEVELNIAINDGGYKITNTGSAFTGLDGDSYDAGALLPNWRYMEKRLNIKFTDKATGDTRDANWSTALNESFANADLINATTSNINKEGQNGNILDLMQYVNVENPEQSQLPNISKFLQMNPVLAQTIKNNNKLFYAPYFDGFGEPEHFFHMNQTMVKNILDSEDGAGKEGETTGLSVDPFNNYTKDEEVDITVGTGEDAEKQTITKKCNGKNAITAVKASGSPKEIISNLKAHLRAVYGDYIGEGNVYEKLSDIYLSESAAYDTDELIALMYAIHNNEALAQGVAEGSQTEIKLFIARENASKKSNQRAVNVLQGLGIMYGVRGALESKCNAGIYLDKDGNIKDGRGTSEFADMFKYASQMYNDKLIAPDYNTIKGISYVKTNEAFMIHDYMNNSTNNANTLGADGKNVDFQAVLPPVAKWDDGISDTKDYYHFSESNRSGAKTESWCIPARVANDQNKLAAALTLVDYLYSIEGDMLMNYGPNAEQVQLYGGANPNGYCTNTEIKSVSSLRGGTISHYTMSDEALNAMNNKVEGGSKSTGAGWNKWSKGETGANLPIGFVREFFAEKETMSVNGVAGYEKVSAAFAVTKTYKTLQLDPNKFYNVEGGNTWYFFTAIPSLALSTEDAAIADTKKNVTSIFNGDADNAANCAYVKYGFGKSGNITREQYNEYVATDITGDNGLEKLYQNAYNRIKGN